MRKTMIMTDTSRTHRRQPTERTQKLAAATLAQKIGYLRIETLPDSSMFERLLTRSFKANRNIRLKDELALIKNGQIEVSHKQYGKSVKTLKAGILFGEMALLGQSTFGTEVKAGTEGATIAVMDAEAAREWIRQNPLSLMEILGPKLVSTEADHYRARFHLAEARLALALLEMAGEGREIVGLSHAEIGQQIGLFRETVTNTLGTLKMKGLVNLGRRRITILNKKALREMSEM